MKKFACLFFDLDHTLWDYDRNARKVLSDLYLHFELHRIMPHGLERFLDMYFKVNESLWNAFNQGRIAKEVIRNDRFERVMAKCGADGYHRCAEMSDYFVYHCPRQSGLMAGAKMTLNYLSKKYHMSIITNGFDEVQEIKMKASGLDQYFEHVITSETIGIKKPHAAIFQHALKCAGVSGELALMVGDNPNTDIIGAENAGITPLLYNPTGRIKSTCELEISHLQELMTLL